MNEININIETLLSQAPVLLVQLCALAAGIYVLLFLIEACLKKSASILDKPYAEFISDFKASVNKELNHNLVFPVKIEEPRLLSLLTCALAAVALLLFTLAYIYFGFATVIIPNTTWELNRLLICMALLCLVFARICLVSAGRNWLKFKSR